MKVLIVEDEQKTGDYLKQGLTEAGFVVDLVRDGLDGVHQALTEDYDLVVLDVMLPKLDGWQVLQRVRQGGKHLPVLFLSARDQIEDRVKGLELGADDYLVKPFAFSEFLQECVHYCAVEEVKRLNFFRLLTWNWTFCDAESHGQASVLT